MSSINTEFDPSLFEADYTDRLNGERETMTVFAGGGSGAAFAPELADIYDLTVITGIGDSGGATGEIRRVFGGGATGDLRNIIGAVSGNPAGSYLNRRLAAGAGLAEFRSLGEQFVSALETRNGELGQFASDGRLHDLKAVKQTVDFTNFLAEYHMDATGRSDLAGHTWGNFLLTALRLQNDDDIAKAAHIACAWVEAKAKVMPATTTEHDLIMDDDGSIIATEGDIDDYAPKDPLHAQLELEAQDPHAEVNMHPAAWKAVVEADKLAVLPGSLYTSQLAILGVKGVASAIAEHGMRADGNRKFVLFGNLVEEKTIPGITVGNHAMRLFQATGRRFDLLVYHAADPATDGSVVPLRVEQDDLAGDHVERAVGTMLLADTQVVHDPSDLVAAQGLRSSVRHDVNRAVAALQ